MASPGVPQNPKCFWLLHTRWIKCTKQLIPKQIKTHLRRIWTELDFECIFVVSKEGFCGSERDGCIACSTWESPHIAFALVVHRSHVGALGINSNALDAGIRFRYLAELNLTLVQWGAYQQCCYYIYYSHQDLHNVHILALSSFTSFLNNLHWTYSPAAHYAQFSHPKCELLLTDPQQRAPPGLGGGKRS